MDCYHQYMRYFLNDNKWFQRLTAATFLLFFCFISLTNYMDWDHFFTSAETDWHSWMIDHQLPLWSNQYCGGVTRLGDPQAFSLSLFFLPVLIFGPFWGLKLLMLFTSMIGFAFQRNLLKLFLKLYKKTSELNLEEKNLITLLSLSFVFGNYFLHHLHSGHVGFVFMYLIPGLLYYILKALFFSIRLREGFTLSFLVWVFFSGGFYHAFIFFLLPLLLGMIFFITYLIGKNIQTPAVLKSILIRIFKISVFSLIGLTFSAYKWYSIYSYQKFFPRVVQNQIESPITVGPLLYQFFPTFGDYYLGRFMQPDAIYGTWEYSAFSIHAVIFLTLVVFLIFENRKNLRNFMKVDLNAALLLPFCFILSYLLFSLGNLTNWLPFGFLNQLLNHSVRVLGRFQIMLSFSITFLTLIIMVRNSRLMGLMKKRFFALFILILIQLNFLTFWNHFSLNTLIQLSSIPRTAEAKMNQISNGILKRDRFYSYMFPEARKGRAFLDCYNPIIHQKAITDRFQQKKEVLFPDFTQVPDSMTFKLIDPEQGFPPEACQKNSYFTENNVYLDPSCPPGTCINLNGMNIYQKTSLSFHLKIGKYCLNQVNAQSGKNNPRHQN